MRASAEQGLEGIVAKRLESSYEPGRRSPCWIKVKNVERQEVVIGGWMPRRPTARAHGALIVGVTEDGGSLRYAGRVGTGFTEDELDRLAALLARTARTPRRSPRAGRSCPRRRLRRARFVAEVEFREWTQGGQLRAPVLQGLRDDRRRSSSCRRRRRARVHTSRAASCACPTRQVLYPRAGFTTA